MDFHGLLVEMVGEQVLGEASGGIAGDAVSAEAGVQGEAAQGGERLAEGSRTAGPTPLGKLPARR